MKQINIELQTMATGFMARHNNVLTLPVCAWLLVSTGLPKIREHVAKLSGGASDKGEAMYAALLAEIGTWRKSHFAANGFSESKFDVALTDAHRMAVTSKALQEIDRINAM